MASQRSNRVDPGVFPPLPHKDPGWGGVAEVGRGLSAGGLFCMRPTIQARAGRWADGGQLTPRIV